MHRAHSRVRIIPDPKAGSTILLGYLTATVIGPHPIARGWVKIHLDANDPTPYAVWPIAEDRLQAI